MLMIDGRVTVGEPLIAEHAGTGPHISGEHGPGPLVWVKILRTFAQHVSEVGIASEMALAFC